MRRRPAVQRLAPGQAPSNRFAWWAAFLTTIALIAILNVVRADAAALPAPGGGTSPIFAELESEEPEEELVEEEEEEEEEEDLFGGDEECEGDEEAECVEEAEEEWPPRECRLSSTAATVNVYPHGRRVVLTVRYRARVSTRVEISYRLRGTRGGLKMDTDRGRFAGTGSFREVQTMTPAQMTRVLAAKTFLVEIRPLGAPAYCHAYFDRRLSVRRSTPRGPVWTD